MPGSRVGAESKKMNGVSLTLRRADITFTLRVVERRCVQRAEARRSDDLSASREGRLRQGSLHSL